MLDAGLPRRRFLAAGAALAAGLTATGYGVANGNSAGRVLDPLRRSFDSNPVPVRMPFITAPPDAVAAEYAGRQPAAWGAALPGIKTGIPSHAKRFALTFDACGGPGNNDVDENLLSFLVAQQIPATLFLNKRWIDANPARAAQLAANPQFELANHGTAHKPLSVTGRAAYEIKGTATVREAVDEVWANHERLTALTGHPPRFFRPGTAHYDDIAVAITTALGETPLGYTLNADYGATSTAAQVNAAMLTAEPGGIALAHMHRPRSGTAAGMYQALPALRANGFEFVKVP